MDFINKLLGKVRPQNVNLEETLAEAFRLGESVDLHTRRSAIELYTQIVHRSPICYVAWFNMGVIQSRIDKWQDAVLSFAKAQGDRELRLVAAFARLKLLVDHGQSPRDVDFPEEFQGDNRGALGVQGPCHNVANELRNRGYKCTVDGKGQSCTVMCDTPNGEYIITVDDMLGMLVKNVYRREGSLQINLGDAESLSETDREMKRLDIGHLALVQAPVSTVIHANGYRAQRQIAERKVGPHGWVRLGRSFDEVAEQNAKDAARSGVKLTQLTSLENIAKSNFVAGSFLACVLDGEPHALAMLETIEDTSKPTLKRAVEGGACVFRAEYFAMSEYPLVHIGLGLPARFIEGDKVAFMVVENVANFVEANFQDWVSVIEIKKYTLVDLIAPDYTLVASGRNNLEPKVITEIVDSVKKANYHFSTIPERSRDYTKAVEEFYRQNPEPFIWSVSQNANRKK